jgi:hypothetical protein
MIYVDARWIVTSVHHNQTPHIGFRKIVVRHIQIPVQSVRLSFSNDLMVATPDSIMADTNPAPSLIYNPLDLLCF